jgi:hypothetical protein
MRQIEMEHTSKAGEKVDNIRACFSGPIVEDKGEVQVNEIEDSVHSFVKSAILVVNRGVKEDYAPMPVMKLM